MARIRTVKPGYFTHPSIVVLTPWARLLLLSLLTQADDGGRLYDQPRKIGGNAFGDDDDVDTEQLLEELRENGRIVRYRAGDRRCIQIVGFRDHQAISKPKASDIPGPAESGTAPGAVRDTTGSPPGGKGREGNREQGREVLEQPAAKSRARDPLFDSLAEIEGSNPQELTRRAARTIGVALAEIRKATPGLTPEEIHRRAAIYPSVMPPDSTLTASALAKHWARCDRPGRPRGRSAQVGDIQRQLEAAEGVSDEAERSRPDGGTPPGRVALP